MPPQRSQPSYAQPTKASQRRQNIQTPPDSTLQKSPSGSTPQKSPVVKTGLQAPSQITVTSQTATTDTQRASQRGPRVTDKDFRTAVLPRYGIDIIKDHHGFSLGGAYHHFGTDAPGMLRTTKDELVQWYHSKYGLEDSFIWLSLQYTEACNIAHEYQQMVLAEEEEAKFSFYAKTVFFQQDIAHIPQSSSRKRSAYCKMEWAPIPDGQLLRCPPVVKDIGPTLEGKFTKVPFGFTNKPDCTFWLPMVQFNAEYRYFVPSVTYVVPKAEVLVPYLTIEFKKADQDTTAAENQLAAAAALILFNRLTLRVSRLNDYISLGKHARTIADFVDLKHYGVAFSAQHVRIFIIKPRLKEPIANANNADGQIDVESLWQGCTVRLLVTLDMTTEVGVLEMRRWVNEIQRWALAEHSAELVVDIKGILKRSEGGEQRVSLLPDEMRKLGLETDPNAGSAT